MSSLGVRGRERTLLAVGGELLARGAAVDFLTPRPTAALEAELPAGARLLDLERWWMRASGLGRNNKLRVYLSTPVVARYLREEKPDVLLAGSIPPSLTALRARRWAGGDTRIVLRQSNVVHIPGSERYGGVKRRPRDRFIPGLYAEADAVIAVSEGVAENVVALAGLDPARVHVVPNRNVPPDLAERAREPVDHPWFQPGALPVFLAVGRFVEKKDYPTLLRAFARLRARREAHLAILGREGRARPAVESLISELGVEKDVEILGFHPNPFAFMSKASAFVLSSISEGMPNVLVEAIACGCPSVSTDCPSGPSEILDGGRFGALVPVGDVDALAAAMEAVLDDPPDREQLRARGAEYGIEGAVAPYVEVLLSQLAPEA